MLFRWLGLIVLCSMVWLLRLIAEQLAHGAGGQAVISTTLPPLPSPARVWGGPGGGGP